MKPSPREGATTPAQETPGLPRDERAPIPVDAPTHGNGSVDTAEKLTSYFTQCIVIVGIVHISFVVITRYTTLGVNHRRRKVTHSSMCSFNLNSRQSKGSLDDRKY